MHKRILSIVLCLAMMLSFAVPAYATGETTVTDEIFIDNNIIVSDGEIITSYDEDGNMVITTETQAPVEETEAPAEETEASAEETEAPVEETEAPVEETEAEEILTDDDLTVEEEVVSEEDMGASTYAGFYVVAENGTYEGTKNTSYGDLSGGDGTITILLDGDGQPDINGDSGNSWQTDEKRFIVDGGGILYLELQHKDLYGTGKTTSDVNELVWDLMQIRVTGGSTLVIRLGGSFEGDETITLRYKKNDNGSRPFDVFPMFDVDNGNLLIRWSNVSTLPTDLGVATSKVSYFAHTADDWTDSGADFVPMIIDGQNFATNIQPGSEKDHPLILLRSTSGTARNFFIEDVQFKNAKYRAIRCYANEMANLVVKDCTFDNTVQVHHSGSENGGAAINIEVEQLWKGAGTARVDIANFTVDHCKFDGVKGNDDGGAIESYGRIHTTEIKNSKFLNLNTKQIASDGVTEYGSHGGAIAFKGYMNKVLFDSVEFNNCVVQQYGGAVFFEGHKNANNNWSKFNQVTFQNCTFKDCVSRKQHGGAIATLAQIHTLKVLGCKFEGCKSLSNGAAISINGKSLADFNSWQEAFADAEVNNTFKYQFASGGNYYSSVDTFLIDAYNGTQTQFLDCKASTSGGAIEIAQNTYVIDMDIKNTLIQGCKAVNNGAAIFLSSPVVESLNIEDTTVTQCGYIKGIPDGSGGFQKDDNGQYIDAPNDPSATLITEGDAGGVIRSTGATTCVLTMKNCTVTDNYSYSNGGGLYWNACYDRGILDECYATVTDCTFSGNYSEISGGGIYCESKLTISGCKIFDNYARLYGGGIAQQVYSNSGRMLQAGEQTNLTIQSYTNPDTNETIVTEIYNNYSDRYGGGVSIRANPTKSIQASNAGVGHAVILNLNDAIIRNNTAKIDGGGIYFVELRDYPGYYDTDENGKDIVTSDAESIATNNAELDTYVKSITITGAQVYENRSGIAQDWSTSAKTESLNGGNGGGIFMSASNQTTLNVNSGNIYSNTATKGNGGGIYMAGENALCHISGGTIGGAESVTYNEDGTVNTITNATPNYATRADSVGGCGGGIAISGGARIEMTGGKISHNVVKHNVAPAKPENETNCQGGGIWLNHSEEITRVDGTTATLKNSMTLDGGHVCHNSTPGRSGCDGGGIYVGKQGTFQIDNGEVSYNASPYAWGGGISSYISAKVTVNGGTISHNKANEGAGIQNYNGTTTINGGTIENNTAGMAGGAIRGAYCSVNVNGGTIQNNTAALGGGIAANASWGTIYVNGGEIKNNTASIAGGGLFVSAGSAINVQKYTKDDVTTYGTITKNTAPLGGGLAVFDGGALTVTGGFITYNTAKGTPPQTTAMIEVLDDDDAFPAENALHLMGVGGGIFVADGESDTKPSRFTLQVSADSKVAIYANLADFGADDVFANGTFTKLSIPSTADMYLGDYGLPVIGWFEDYPNEDTNYPEGLASTPGGVDPYARGDANGYFSSNENVRYRNVDAAKRREAVYSSDLDSYAPNQANEYVCLTLGIPAACDDVVVVDFGLPVDIDVIANDVYLGNDEYASDATLAAIGVKRTADANAFTTELETGVKWSNKSNGGNFANGIFTETEENIYFIATKNGDKIRFTPKKIDMKDPIEFAYAVSSKVSGSTDTDQTYYFYANVTVIPATNVYFEDSFISFTDATGANDDFGKWTTDGSAESKDQELDVPGPNADTDRPELDADNVYGYDDAYANCTTYSLGSAQKVTVDKTTGAKANAPKATFSFTGTGFDVVSLTNNDSGALWVTVKDASGKQVKSIVVNNYYGYTYCLCQVTYVYEFDKWVRYIDGKAPAGAVATEAEKPSNPNHNTKVTAYENDWIVDKDASVALYQVPVIKVDDLVYGTYSVEMQVVYLNSQDMQKDGSYTVWIDAVRIYNPRQSDPTSENVYVQDGESNVVYLNVSDNIANGLDTFTNAKGFGYVDGKRYGKTADDQEAFLSEYNNYGPNNEAYLKYNDGFVFKLRYYSETSPAGGTFHIGAKLGCGTSAELGMTHNGKNIATTVITTCTNMFYKCPDLNWVTCGTDDDGNTYWETDVIYIRSKNNAVNSILALTDLKLSVPYGVAPLDTVETPLMAIVDTEAAKFAEDIIKAELAENEKAINLEYPTLSFEDEVKYNIYYTTQNIDVAVEDMGLITWSAKPEDATIETAETVVPGAAFNPATGEYMVRTNGIPAKKLGDNVYFRVYAKLADGTYVYSQMTYYSAKIYATERLKYSTSADMKAACVAMLNYGAAAQIHFGYNTENLMNADLTAEQKALVNAYSADMVAALPTVDTAKAGEFVANGGFTNGYPTVSFEGAFAINYYFIPNKTIDGDLTLYCWDLETYNSVDKLTEDNATAKIVMTQTATGEYFATYTGIAAKQIDETVFVAGVYESDGVRYSTNVVPYSVGAYCADRAANGSDTMKAFAAETAVYGHYAQIYFDNLQK